MWGDELAIRVAYDKWRAAGFCLTGHSERELDLLAADPDWRAAVEQERVRRAPERIAQRFATATHRAAVLAEHVLALAAVPPAIQVKTFTSDSHAGRYAGRGLSSGVTREVLVRAIVDERTYAIALHELVHQRANHNEFEQLKREVLAWQWAYDHAILWKAEAEIALGLGLSSHIQASTNPFAIVDAEAFMRAPRTYKGGQS